MNGAELIIYPTTIGWYPGDKEICGVEQQLGWELVMRSHAIVNGVFVAAVNRAGWQGPTEYWGSSFVCDPAGKVLARARVAEAELFECQLDYQVDLH
jgi:N-carbamoylputrescine amidase